MKIDPNSFVPFKHDNLDFKQRVLNIAREQNQTLEGILTATLIYVNGVDYIASHVLENLRQITYLVSYGELNAVVFYDYKNTTKSRELPLGEVINRLEDYTFPDKEEFIEELREFKKLRNKYVHNFLNIPPDKLDEVGIELGKIIEIGERLLNRYDQISKGISLSWYAYRSGKVPVPTKPEEPQAQQKEATNPKKEKNSRKSV